MRRSYIMTLPRYAAPLSFCLRVALPERQVCTFGVRACTLFCAGRLSPEAVSATIAWQRTCGMGYLSDSGRIAPSVTAANAATILSRCVHEQRRKNTPKAQKRETLDNQNFAFLRVEPARNRFHASPKIRVLSD